MARIIKDSKGQKLYPVCGFQKSQHKLYYWRNKAWLKVFDNDNATEKDYEELDFWDDVMNYATSEIYDGLIYIPYKYYNRVKEAIVAYDFRH